jgi:hypothetical protein
MIFQDGIDRLIKEIYEEFFKEINFKKLYENINEPVINRIAGMLKIRYTYEINMLDLPEEMISGIIRDIQSESILRDYIITTLTRELCKRGCDPDKIVFKMGLLNRPVLTCVKPVNFYSFICMCGFTITYEEYLSGITKDEIDSNTYFDTWVGRFYWKNQKIFGIIYNEHLLPPSMNILFGGGVFL